VISSQLTHSLSSLKDHQFFLKFRLLTRFSYRAAFNSIEKSGGAQKVELCARLQERYFTVLLLACNEFTCYFADNSVPGRITWF